MGRSVRKMAILAKIETTPGADAVPTGAANALLVSELSITPFEATNVDLDYIRAYFGGSPQLSTSSMKKISFTVDLAASGTAGTAPAFGAVLRACAVGEAVLAAPARVEYLPISDAIESATIYAYDDGVLHKYLCARGTLKLSAQVSDRPKMMFEFTALDGGEAAATNPATTLTAFKIPLAVRAGNVVDVTLGATYTAGAVTGGTVYPSRGLEIDFSNDVQYTPTLSGEAVDIVDRSVKASLELDLTAAQEVALMAQVRANATQSLAFQIGATAGSRVVLFAPAAQLTSPSKRETNKRRFIGFDVRLLPVVGNDELRIALT